MERVRLFHWNVDEAAPVLEVLRRAGFEVEYQARFEPAILRGMRQTPPDAVVIDLSRLPSHGREVATVLRGNKQTRSIPILFVDGTPEKLSIVRQALPDADYCERPRLIAALRKCIKARPKSPVVPTQMMDRYAGRTTAQKLGIRAGARVAVVDAPRDYARVIGVLPDGAELVESSSPDPATAVTIWFVEEPESFLAALPKMRRAAAESKLWVAWPKKAARPDSLLTENVIRGMAIERGLVDYKVCSVNETWSGLCFSVKKTAKA
jgi:CheY-like chemotaxis protein